MTKWDQWASSGPPPRQPLGHTLPAAALNALLAADGATAASVATQQATAKRTRRHQASAPHAKASQFCT
jgi:hypothetical protein